MFSPAMLTVPVGTDVTWASHDVVFHTATSDDLSISSGLLRIQGSATHTFEEPGEYD